MCLKEPQLVLVIRHQNVLGVTVMIEHHFMGLAPEAGLLVAAE
jgi:hypothetical protein